jgi:hypothetical protein
MKHLSIVVMFAIALCAVSAHAQNRASETELRAGYCIGVINEWLDGIRSAPPPTSTELEKIKQGAIKELEGNKRRFATYLASSNATGDMSMVVAIQRGKAEATECRRLTDQLETRPAACFRTDPCGDPGKMLPFPYGQ